MKLRDWLKAAPEGVTLSWEPGALAKALEDQARDDTEWVGMAEAVEITGRSDRFMRRKGAQWERMQLKGLEPPVRVRRKSDALSSHILFDEAQLRHAYGKPAVPEDETEDVAVVMARAAFRRHTDASCSDTRRGSRGSTGSRSTNATRAGRSG